jgi:hypothetical protein
LEKSTSYEDDENDFDDKNNGNKYNTKINNFNSNRTKHTGFTRARVIEREDSGYETG